VADAEKKKRKRKAPGKTEGPEEKTVSSEKKPKAGTPGWVTTFADLMSLLMCFFVMLVSMASVERTTFAKMASSVKDGLGGGKAEIAEESKTSIDVKIESKKNDKQDPATKLSQELVEEIQDGQVEIDADGDALKIQLLQSATFGAGSDKLKKSFKPIAEKLKQTLSKTKGTITVVGHTDDQPIKSRKFRSNWELASSRAGSVIASLAGGKKLSIDRFSIRSYGSSKPRVPNDTAENRALNRRISIIVQKTGKSKQDPAADKSMVINSENVDSISSEKLMDFLTEEPEAKDNPEQEESPQATETSKDTDKKKKTRTRTRKKKKKRSQKNKK
jgi:chemotaxis protein MotB